MRSALAKTVEVRQAVLNETYADAASIDRELHFVYDVTVANDPPGKAVRLRVQIEEEEEEEAGDPLRISVYFEEGGQIYLVPYVVMGYYYYLVERTFLVRKTTNTGQQITVVVSTSSQVL